MIMQTIKFYFESVPDSTVKVFECAISDWYCKPAILSCLSFKVGCRFVTCSKYGRRQFTPLFSESFPVHDWEFKDYKSHLPWLVLEFNDYSLASPWSDGNFYRELLLKNG